MSNERVPQKELKLYICKLKKIFFPPVLVPRVSWKVITISAAMPVFWAMKGNIARGMLWSYHTETTRHICFFAFRLAEMIIVLGAKAGSYINLLVLILLSLPAYFPFCRCSSGYHGNPRVPGGTCQRCDCSPRGSVHGDCDRGSGQCVCRPGAAGLQCEECEPRHILVESNCICGYFPSLNI